MTDAREMRGIQDRTLGIRSGLSVISHWASAIFVSGQTLTAVNGYPPSNPRPRPVREGGTIGWSADRSRSWLSRRPVDKSPAAKSECYCVDRGRLGGDNV